MSNKTRVNISLDKTIHKTAKLIAIDMETTVSGLFTACIQVCEKDYPKNIPIPEKNNSEISNVQTIPDTNYKISEKQSLERIKKLMEKNDETQNI